MSDCSNASDLHPPFVSQTKLNPLGRDSAVRERYRDEYWRTHDPIVEDRLLWRDKHFATRFITPGPVNSSSAAAEVVSRAPFYAFRGMRIQLQQ